MKREQPPDGRTFEPGHFQLQQVELGGHGGAVVLGERELLSERGHLCLVCLLQLCLRLAPLSPQSDHLLVLQQNNHRSALVTDNTVKGTTGRIRLRFTNCIKTKLVSYNIKIRKPNTRRLNNATHEILSVIFILFSVNAFDQ